MKRAAKGSLSYFVLTALTVPFEDGNRIDFILPVASTSKLILLICEVRMSKEANFAGVSVPHPLRKNLFCVSFS